MSESCIVIAQGLPSSDNGFGIAMRSSLALYERAFDRVLYLCISEELSDPHIIAEFPRVHFRNFLMRRPGYARRFLASIPTGLPACVMQMHDKVLRRAVLDAVQTEIRDDCNTWCIVENLAPSIFIPALKNQFSSLKLVYRSHDVSELAFARFSKGGALPLRWLWKWELARIHRLESQSLELADLFWTITLDDAHAFSSLHNRTYDGVMGVQLDLTRYKDIPAGSCNRLLYLGSSDIRKAKGLYRFLTECWPLVRKQHPKMEFWIGGPGTARFDKTGPGIHAVGLVDDEREFLGQGRAFINPQEDGTGIQLKSLVALAAGKLLISSINGVTGIVGGKSGHHFLASNTPEGMAKDILLLLNEPAQVETIASSGYQLVHSHYDMSDHATFDTHFAHLLGREL